MMVSLMMDYKFTIMSHSKEFRNLVSMWSYRHGWILWCVLMSLASSLVHLCSSLYSLAVQWNKPDDDVLYVQTNSLQAWWCLRWCVEWILAATILVHMKWVIPALCRLLTVLLV